MHGVSIFRPEPPHVGHACVRTNSPKTLRETCCVRPDQRFVREGNDIFSTVDLTMTQAALGVTVAIPTLEGVEEIEFEAGTQPGTVRVLRGKGMPVLQGFGHGDQRVLVNVVVPRHLSDEQRLLLHDFDAHADERTYKPDDGFFDKLKSAFR